MNQQKIYDRVRKHLLTQGRKAGYTQTDYHGDGEFLCQYRTYDPTAKKVLKCAVGCLIPFRNYNPEHEGDSVASEAVSAMIPPSLGVITKEDRAFLADLQGIHDHYEVENWPARLDRFASKHGLRA